MTMLLQVPRSRGAISGLLLVLLGAWGALIPFVGPYVHYAYTPDAAWTYTTGRLWLDIVPGAAALVGGVILLISATRPVAMIGAELAAAAGAWFVLGALLSPLWPAASTLSPGAPVAGTVSWRLEQLGFFTGLGVVIVFVAALALGRLTVVGVRDTRLAATRGETAGQGAAADGERAAAAEGEPAVGARTSRVHSFSRWLVTRS
jgi:hypothetical protein